ncbi:hypothetical protein S83_028616, partial [Arachis hypogaea]
LPPPSHLPSPTTLRTRRRDKGVEGGRPRKKEEALFVLLRPVAVRGVTVVAAVRSCVTEPLSPENSIASPGSTADGNENHEKNDEMKSGNCKTSTYHGKGFDSKNRTKRFEFDKDAPLEDEEIEVAEDDASLVKQIGQSFQYSKIEARREEQIQAAHDEAMFGASSLPPPTSTDSEPERENEKEVNKKAVVTSLLSETVSVFTADLCG